jgi:hypothetical protein
MSGSNETGSRLELRARVIGEREILDSQPLVRAEVVNRLQLLWDYCVDGIDAGRFDHRKAMLGLAVTKELARAFRINERAEVEPDPSEELTPRQRDLLAIEASLVELEGR